MKNILNYWLVGAEWICWFWAAASLPGLVFLATPPQIPIHFPLFTFFHCDCVLIFHWDDWDLLLFNSTEAVFRVWETFHLKKERNQKHNTQLFKWNCIYIYLYIITTATATARFCVKISWGLDSLIEDPHSIKKWFLDFTIPKKTCFLLSLK